MSNKTAKEAVEKTIPPKFTIERLRASCIKLFGITASTFDGATYGLTGQFTVDAMKEHIDKWLKKPMKGGK